MSAARTLGGWSPVDMIVSSFAKASTCFCRNGESDSSSTSDGASFSGVQFSCTNSGTTYTVYSVEDGPAYVDADTEIAIAYPDSHVPDGSYDVTFEDVGGLGTQIRQVRELVQLPLKFPHVYRQLGITAPRGIILYGPPGAGKTRIARAMANEIEARFYYINGPDIIGTYAGILTGQICRMFIH